MCLVLHRPTELCVWYYTDQLNYVFGITHTECTQTESKIRTKPYTFNMLL